MTAMPGNVDSIINWSSNWCQRRPPPPLPHPCSPLPYFQLKTHQGNVPVIPILMSRLGRERAKKDRIAWKREKMAELKNRGSLFFRRHRQQRRRRRQRRQRRRRRRRRRRHHHYCFVLMRCDLPDWETSRTNLDLLIENWEMNSRISCQPPIVLLTFYCVSCFFNFAHHQQCVIVSAVRNSISSALWCTHCNNTLFYQNTVNVTRLTYLVTKFWYTYR